MEGVERLDEALLDVGKPLAGERDLDRRVPEMPLDDLRVRSSVEAAHVSAMHSQASLSI